MYTSITTHSPDEFQGTTGSDVVSQKWRPYKLEVIGE